MKELTFYYDNLPEPNCMPNDMGVTFGNYGFIVTRATGISNFDKIEKDFKINLLIMIEVKNIFMW